MKRKLSALVLIPVVLAGIAGCGRSPADPDSATVMLDLEFPTDSTAAAAPVTEVRIHTLDAATGAVLVTHDVTVAAGVSERMIALHIKQNLDRILIFEVLLRTAPEAGGETLWIGRTEPLDLEPGDSPRPPVVFVRAAPAGA